MTLQTVPVAQNVSPEYSTGTGSTSFFLPVFENSSKFPHAWIARSCVLELDYERWSARGGSAK